MSYQYKSQNPYGYKIGDTLRVISTKVHNHVEVRDLVTIVMPWITIARVVKDNRQDVLNYSQLRPLSALEQLALIVP